MNRRRFAVALAVAPAVPSLATRVAAQDSDPDIAEMQETVEAMQTEVATAGYDSIPEADELSQSRFDRKLANATEAEPAFGPTKGSLSHDEQYIALEFSAGYYANFVLSARFTNPIEDADETFDFGVEFRISGDYVTPSRIYLIFSGNGSWYASVGTDEEWSAEEELNLGTGEASSFDDSVDGVNELTLIVEDQQAHFAINGEYVASIGLPPAVVGAVAIGTGFYTGDAVDGRVTRFREFTVWSQD